MSSRILGVVASLVLLCGGDAHASPESWLWFGASVRGVEAGSRFGAELACSRGVLDSGRTSIVAVGAPQEANSEGRVYLYDSLELSTPLQVLDPAAGNVVQQFGAAIQFIDDINRDGVDELLIGAPGGDDDTEGRLYAFTSVLSGGLLNNRSVQYAMCGTVYGPVGFAQELQSLRFGGGSSASNVVVGNPRSGRTDSFRVFANEGGECLFASTTDFLEARSVSSRFGASLTQVGSSANMTFGDARIVVAAPGDGASGLIYERRLADSIFAVDLERAGSIVSGHYNSSTYVAGVPRSNNSRGGAVVYSTDAMRVEPLCEISNEVAEFSGNFGSNVQHLGGSFLGFFWAAQEVVAVRSSGNLTGGALSLVGVTEDGCIAPLSVNNCQLDPLQEQGMALAGGEDCQVYLSGRVQRLLASGSPGWSGEQGRVDIAFEEGMLDLPLRCPADDETVSPLSTLAPLLMIQEGSLEIPAVTPTATNFWTAESVATDTPSVTPSSDPTTSQDLEIGTPVVNPDVPPGNNISPTPTGTPPSTSTPLSTSTPSPTDTPLPTSTLLSTTTPRSTSTPFSTDTPLATDTPLPTSTPPLTNTPLRTSTPSPTDTPIPNNTPLATSTPLPTDTPFPTGTSLSMSTPSAIITTPLSATPHGVVPIVVAPGSGGLSAPEVLVRAGQVEVRMPVVAPQLTEKQRMKVIRQLQRKGRLSQNKAAQLLSDPDNLSVTYILHYKEVSAPRQFSLIQSAYAQDSRRRAAKARQIRTRLNNVTLRNLRPGATFKVWYTVEVSVKKTRRVLGITQPSAVTTFRAS